MASSAFDKMWDGDDGLMDDYDFTITSAKFGYTDYNQGNTLLLLLEGEAVTDTGAVIEHTAQYSCGSKHEPVGNGESAIHVTGEVKPFNKRAGIMDLVNAASKLGALDDIKAQGKTPAEASIWAGLKFHMNRVKVSEFTPEGESEKRDVIRELPTAFLGKAEGGTSTSVAASPAPAATSAPASNGGGNGAVSDAALTVMARQSGGDYISFLEIAGKSGIQVTDPRLDEKGPIWQSVVSG